MTMTYLGRVRDVFESRDGYRFARVEPLYQSGEGRTWRPFREPVDQAFPSRGLVFWHDAPATVEKGSHWQFGVVENPSYDGNEKLEKYQIDQPEPVIEIIDLHSLEEQRVRRLLTEEGLQLDLEPIAADVLIWVDEDHWVGPVRLMETRGGWTVEATEDLARIQRRRLPPAEASLVDLCGKRIVLNPRREFGELVGFCNWMTDYQFASGLLRRLRKLDRNAFDGLDVTYAVFDEYLRAMEEAGLIGTDLEVELGRRERLQDLKKMMEENSSLLNEAVSALHEIKQFGKELEGRKEEEYKRIREELEQRVESELAGRRAELGRFEQEVEQVRLELERLEGELASKHEELDALSHRFDDALAQRLSRLLEAPEETFADLAIFRKIFAPSAVPGSARENPPERVKVLPTTTTTTRITDTGELIGVLGKKLAARGASPFMAPDLHSAFLTGAVPIVTGPNAYDALDAYASTVAGARLCWIPISGTTFEPQELLGRFDPVAKRIIPHPGGLLDILAEARESDQLYLVVLEGLNRAPVESYLLPLLESFSDASLGRRARTIPLAPRDALDPADPYHGHHRVMWEPNVLLAATPVFGTATLPLPEAIWDHAILIDTDRYASMQDAVATSGDAGERAEAYEVGHDEWVGFRRVFSDDPVKGIDRLAGLSDPAHLHPVVARLYKAALSCGMGEDAALRVTVTTGVLPRLGDHGVEHLGAYADLVSLSENEVEAIADLSRRLIG